MAPELALELAQAALKACRDRGFQVAVAVTDRFGLTQVMLRDSLAGQHTPETAQAKARTAVSFRTTTEELSALTQAGQPNSAIRHLPGFVFLGGPRVIVRGYGPGWCRGLHRGRHWAPRIGWHAGTHRGLFRCYR